jgi:CO dehydrogenase maturation factor
MPLFHCPLGAVCYESEGCIRCGLCIARTRDEAVEASKKLREYLKTHASARQKKYMIHKIAICGKGGVGKSTTVTLLAKVLLEYGYSVLVMDTDESNPGLYRMFGFEKEPKPLMKLLSRFSLGEPEPNTQWLINDEISFRDIPPEFLLEKDNLRFMMVGKIDDPFQGCACTMADVTRDLMIKLTLKEKEIVLIDQEAGVESFGRGVERGVDTVLMIIEPSFESIAVAEKIRYMAEGIGIGRVRAILNKMPSEKIASKVIKELIKKEIRFLGSVLIDAEVSEAGFEGAPLGHSAAKEQIKMIARLMLDEAEMKYKKEEGEKYIEPA